VKVALLLPPFADIYGRFRFLYRRGFLNPPLGFAYVAAAAERRGHRVMIVDAEAEDLGLSEVLSRVSAFGPELIGFTATSPTFQLTTDFATKVKAAFPKVPTVIGGTHVAIFQKAVLEENPVYSFGVIGDGEDALPELLESLSEGSGFEDVKGLLWRGDDTVVQNEFRPLVRDLDVYPFPARHLLRNELYLRNVPYKGYCVSASVVSSRGCPYDCIFCAVKNVPNGTMARFRSPENVIEELKLIVQGIGIRHVAFNDDCLTFHREKVLGLCGMIRSTGLKFTWEGLSRADRVDRELLREMRRAGLNRLSFGIESGNQRILDVLQKHETLEEIANAIRITHEEGIVTRGSVIIGSPYETSKEVEDTFRFITSIKELDEVVVNIMQPYPGTKMREMALKGIGGTKLIETGLSDLRRFGNASMEVNDLSASKLVELQREGMKRFYLRPSKIVRTLAINNPLALACDALGMIRTLWG